MKELETAVLIPRQNLFVVLQPTKEPLLYPLPLQTFFTQVVVFTLLLVCCAQTSLFPQQYFTLKFDLGGKSVFVGDNDEGVTSWARAELINLSYKP